MVFWVVTGIVGFPALLGVAMWPILPMPFLGSTSPPKGLRTTLIYILAWSWPVLTTGFVITAWAIGLVAPAAWILLGWPFVHGVVLWLIRYPLPG